MIDKRNGAGGQNAQAAAEQCCELEPQLLASLFDLTHLPAGHEQSEAHCGRLCDLVEQFAEQALRERDSANQSDGDVDSTTPSTRISAVWTDLSREDAASLHSAVALLRSPCLTWFPDFGCALLGLGQPMPSAGDCRGAAPPGVSVRSRPGELSLYLVTLDEWRFHLHSMRGSTQHTAKCGGHTALFCGAIPAARYQQMVASVRAMIHEALEKRKKKGEHGFQRTPGFVLGAVCKACDALPGADESDGEPAAAEAAAESAVTGPPSNPPLARGGFTDVGQHTGGDTMRETCWPLVKAVVQFALAFEYGDVTGSGGGSGCDFLTPPPKPSSSSPLFPQALAHLDLWLLRRQLLLIQPDTATPTALNTAMHMLRSAATKAAALADQGYDTRAFEAACRQAEAHLSAAAAQRALSAARCVELPPPGSPALSGSCTLPGGVLPEPLLPRAEAGGLAAARQRAERNLGSLPLLAPGASFALMLAWVSSRQQWPGADGDVALQLLMRSVERELFVRATAGFEEAPYNRLEVAEVAALEQVVDVYRSVVQQFLRQQKESVEQQSPQQEQQRQQQAIPPSTQPAVMQVELLSRELLVVWTGYCLMREAARREHPIVSRYGVFGSHHDLRHLVLSDRAAVDAALAVAAYLQRHAVVGRPLFSKLDDGGATMQMAGEFAQGCPRLVGIWAAECRDADDRVAAHWAEVQRKQALARKLRAELAELESEGRSLQSTLNQLRYGYNSDVYEAQRRVDNNARQQQSKRSELAEAEKAPPAVMQPLPKDSGRALRWLFFLHMPPLFRHLSRASFLAQQMLLPRPMSKQVADAISVSYKADLTSYHNAQRHTRTYLPNGPNHRPNGEQGAVKIWSRSAPPDPTSVGPQKVDSFTSPSDGVWYPDGLGPCMAWSGSGSAADQGQGFPAHFNPFAPLPDVSLTELYFTEKLPPPMYDTASTAASATEGGEAAAAESPLQWAMHVRASASETRADRGNQAIATQDTKPSWLSKPAFLEFCSLRAYPLRQLRRLAAALHDRMQPLDQPAVHVLVRQLLYHIGVLTDGGDDGSPPRLRWREGWERPGDVLPALCAELSTLADELQEKRREHEAVLLLGEVASYLAEWHAPCRDVARRFAKMTARVADDLEAEVDAASNDDDVAAALLAKQCRWRCMALMCYGGSGPLNDADDVGKMVQLAVLIHHGRVFLPDASLRAALQPLVVRAHNVLASRAEALVAAVEAPGQRGSALLTAAVARVLPGRTREELGDLTWRRLPGSLASFEAVGSVGSGSGEDGELFSINLLDGTVLFGGWPPNRLPKEVTEHPLYVRTFGNWNFQVAFSGADAKSVMEGLRLIDDRRYRFALGTSTEEQGRRLVITEIDPRVGVELELLDVGADGRCGQWGAQLPTRLRELHSHWLCRSDGVMLLRPRNFLERSVQFIMQVQAESGGPTAGELAKRGYHCWRVPSHLQSRHHWTELLSVPELRQQLTDLLVLLRGCAVQDLLLSKLEEPQFIHAYDSREAEPGLMRLELPRFGLEFEIRPSDGSVTSRDYSGYRLHRRQLLVWEREAEEEGGGGSDDEGTGGSSCNAVQYTLPEFRQYLVLERLPGTGVVQGARREDVLVLVPAGGVEVGQQQQQQPSSRSVDEVRVRVSSASDARLKAHCYEVHGRFRHLRAASIPARLQLAALYAATGTLLPEPLSRATGGQMALQLLRQCWTDRPLGGGSDGSALAQLRSVGDLGGHLVPALRLMAREVEASASQVRHLHEATATAAAMQLDGADVVADAVVGDADAGTSYLQERGAVLLPGGWGPNPRGLLTANEERRTLGGAPAASTRRQPPPEWRRRGLYRAIEVAEALPVSGSYLGKVEERLSGLVVKTASGIRDSAPPYPLMDLSAAVASNGEMAGNGGDGGCAGCSDGDSGGDVTDAAEGRLSGCRNGGATALTPTPLHLSMHRELAGSWAEHHAQLAVEDYGLEPHTEQEIRRIKAEVTQRRAASEEYVFRHLSHVPEDVGCHSVSFRMLRAAGLVPAPAHTDLLRVAWQGEVALLQLNPFLSAGAVQRLREGVLVWLQLCVLEDRLTRLGRLVGAGEEYRIALIRELLVRRTWNPAQYPQWLVFEVEGQLQIRPEQEAVARHLMSHPGAIAQLNMGEGKTRVILPMLALHWADGSQVVRLNLLSTLLDEAYGHLHGTLCAGVLGRKLFTLPFHRGVELTGERVKAMRASMEHCKQEGGLLLVAPEHRLSLQLKRLELGVGQQKQDDETADICTALDHLAAMPYLDLLDESDELLHHRLQLIYACGAPTALPGLQERTTVMQALLHTASRLATTAPAYDSPAEAAAARSSRRPAQQQMQALLPAGAAVLEPPADRSPGAFCGLRLLPGEALEGRLRALHWRLAEELMYDPPYELRWLKQHPLKDRILKCVTDEAISAEEALGPGARGPQPHQLTDDQWAAVLALRGLLGCNLLQHCLQKRHRVDFGVNRNAGARKRMAVPYRAAHTPSERSEFAQPDVALLLTNLSYYYDGLSREEFRAALTTLMGMGLSAQRDFYEGWLRLAANGIPPDELSKFDDVSKIDTSNGPQIETMWRHLRHNRAVVNFWLNHRVYPTETRQYPQRLASSAWHLADNSRRQVVGFSGTNDNHRLLPLQVAQADIPDRGLRATNGKMLSVIGQHTLGFTTLDPHTGDGGDGRPLWRVLLDTALVEGVDALLDCGALLAGASNRHAAEYLRQQLASRGDTTARFQGVTYFDEAERSWVVCDLRGRRLPRHASPIAERDTFVIYDDARCRGADLQLRQSAVGLLTLGPGACKDKVMQAAGRLRQLGRGQRLHFTAAGDVTDKILRLRAAAAVSSSSSSSSAPSPVDVLRWVMSNTVEATQRGVVPWASQGLHFAATRAAPPERALQDEVLQLYDLYGGSMAEQPAAELVKTRAQHVRLLLLHEQHLVDGGSVGHAEVELVERIQTQAAEVGSGHNVVAGAGAGDEECERELEQEEEEEQEVERQVPRVVAASERDWDYASVLGAGSTRELSVGARVVPLADAAVLALQPESLHTIAWSTGVLCSHNFLHAIASLPPGGPLNEYLRPVGALVLFRSGEVLLVSEREADQLQARIWDGARRSGAAASAADAPLLVDLCFARQAFVSGSAPVLALPLTAAGGGGDGIAVAWSRAMQQLGPTQLASVQLFNGEASYGSEALREALRALVWRRREDVEVLVGMRGKLALLPRSDLERACEDP
ncbi:thioredoxin-disulfide reductase [Pleodorina starrii]|uniref:ubiquitinyl hydrolase 1 n=1 Tax=Pleodorina starrii TaxID=330485 RepID=A0A9W6BBQ9_9CHLO|nr:thioredoxin-disulfide reductase [Pleodorina starrii]GLC73556.1 thioredoxin-disulfide reductase [Pleodorina starrii]